METLLTVAEYATAVRQHEDSVRRQLRAGRIPRAIKKGRGWRIPASAVYEDSRQAQAGPWPTAAREMAGIYAGALEGGGELTAITTAPGEPYQQPSQDVPEG